jgi:hypothetical protein
MGKRRKCRRARRARVQSLTHKEIVPPQPKLRRLSWKSGFLVAILVRLRLISPTCNIYAIIFKDVGGGSVSDSTQFSLANISLRWMVREIVTSQCGIIFNEEALDRYGIDLSLPSKTSFSQKLEDEMSDATQPLYDQLKLNALWWILEIIPTQYSYQDGEGKWYCKWRYNSSCIRTIYVDHAPIASTLAKAVLSTTAVQIKAQTFISAPRNVWKPKCLTIDPRHFGKLAQKYMWSDRLCFRPGFSGWRVPHLLDDPIFTTYTKTLLFHSILALLSLNVILRYSYRLQNIIFALSCIAPSLVVFSVNMNGM